MRKNIIWIGALIMIFALGAQAQSVDSSGQSGRAGDTGRAGDDGRDGSRGSNGQDGRDGQQGGEGRRGEDGEHITVRAKSSHGQIEIQTIVGGKNQTGSYALESVGTVFLKANGGDGGRGGWGGTGGDGGDGGRGDNATSYRRGDDGGDGGKGGNGGDGGRGGDGGDGGQVTVQVAEEDTHLLMLFDVDVDGGKGGQGGPGGTAGSGGSGGWGGSSYSWEESYSCPTDEDPGKRCTRTETNSGGSNGSSGSAGRPGRLGQEGRDGQSGTYSIRVDGPQGSSTYSSIYELAMVDFKLIEEFPDGVLEPGERFSLQDITIQNLGGMPSPSSTKTFIFLVSNNFVVAEPQRLELTQSIGVGQKLTLRGQRLDFRVEPAIFENAEQNPLAVGQTLRPEAMMDKVNRKFATFHAGHRVQVRFPIEIEPITPTRSILPGETARLLYKITNRSSKSFGSKAEIQREIKLSLIRSGGDLDPRELDSWFVDGGPLDLNSGIFYALENLGPGQSVIIEFEVKVSEDAEALTDVQINLGLDFEILDRGTERVQNKTTFLRISQAYRARDNSSVVLVVNPGMSNEVVLAWKTLMERSGLQMDIWDLDIYGHLSLTRALADDDLAASLKGKTLIVATNNWRESGAADAMSFVRQQELVQALAENQLNIFLLGPNSPKLEEWILPFYADETRSYKDSREFLTDIGSVGEHIQVGDQMRVPVRQGFWRFRKAGWDRLRAEQLLSNLSRRYPDQRYFIVTPVTEWGAKQVDLVAVRGLDRRSPAGVAQSLSDGEVLDPQWVLRGGPLLGLVLSKPFEEKLPLYSETLGHYEATQAPWLQSLTSALTHDFLLEQQIVGQNNRFPLFNARMVTDNITFLDQFVNLRLARPLDAAVEIEESFLDIFATVKVFSEEMVSFWENLQVLSVDRALKRQTLKRIDDILSNWQGSSVTRRGANPLKVRFLEKVREIRAQLWDHIQYRTNKEAVVHAVVMAPFSAYSIGQTMRSSVADSIISNPEWNRLKAEYQARDSAVAEYSSAYQRERAKLLRP